MKWTMLTRYGYNSSTNWWVLLLAGTTWMNNSLWWYDLMHHKKFLENKTSCFSDSNSMILHFFLQVDIFPDTQILLKFLLKHLNVHSFTKENSFHQLFELFSCVDTMSSSMLKHTQCYCYCHTEISSFQRFWCTVVCECFPLLNDTAFVILQNISLFNPSVQSLLILNPGKYTINKSLTGN